MSMIDNDISKKLIGASVSNLAYGRGCLSKFFLKDDGNYYVSVLFDSIKTEKTYLASTAFIKSVLVLENEELNKAVLLLLARHDSKPIVEVKRVVATKATEISSNGIVNILIDSVLKNEQIATDLITFFDDELFEKELCEEAFSYLEKIINGENIGKAYKACIICALSLIALKYYDGDLHSHIEKKYREYRPSTEYKYTRPSIQNGVYKVLGDFRDRTMYFDPRSYVAVPLVLSCVPHYRLNDLFRIAYDIYKQKLLFDEDICDDQIEEKVLETFVALRRKDLISDSDTIKGTNYLMSKYTQSCIYSGYGINSLSQIVTHCIRLIISHLTRPEDSFKVEPYYSEGYVAWVNSFEADDKEKVRYESNRTKSQPYFRLKNYKVHLYTGEYNMDDSYDPNDVHICIYSDGILIEDKLITDPNAIEYIDCETAMSGFIIRQQELVITGSPLKNLSYTIVCSDRHLYDSKTRLYRSNLFFDGKGNEIKPGSNYSGELFVITKKSNKEEYGDSIKEVFHGDDYIISIVEVNNQEIFRFDGEPYIFFRISSSQMIGYEIPWGDFKSFDGKRFPIYNDITILFPSSCDKEDIFLEIDGQDYYYGDDAETHFSIRLFSKEHGETWAYTARVNGLKAGFHSIRVINSNSGKQIKGANFCVVYDPEIWKSFVSKNNIGILYEVSGSFVENQQILFEYGVSRKELHAFVKNLGHGSLTVYPSSISYSIDGITWRDIDNKIFLSEIPESTNTLMVCGPSQMTAFYLDESSTVKKQAISFETDSKDSTKYRLYLSYLRTIHGKKFARISFEYGNRTKYVTISFNPFVIKENCRFFFDSERGVHVFDIRFEGTSKLKAIIKPLHSDSILASKVISSGEVIEIKDSDIDSSIHFLSISLHGRKYGALFDPYQPEPFMCFPKYDLGRPFIRLTTFPPDIKVERGLLSAQVDFEGSTIIKAEIIPSGFSTPLLSTPIHNKDKIILDISILPFNSYKLYLFSSSDKEEQTFDVTPFFISRAVKVESPFLQQTLSVSAFIFNDGSKMKVTYSIRFNTIVEIDNKFYLLATLLDRSNGRKYNDLLISVKKLAGLQYAVAIRRRVDDTLIKIKLKNGKVIDGAIVEKIGGWL